MPVVQPLSRIALVRHDVEQAVLILDRTHGPVDELPDPAVMVGQTDNQSTLCVAYRDQPTLWHVLEGDQVQETTRVHRDGECAEGLAALEDGNISCCRPSLVGPHENVGDDNRTGFKRLVLRSHSLFASGRRQQWLTSRPCRVYE
jgi:hypothetical protein